MKKILTFVLFLSLMLPSAGLAGDSTFFQENQSGLQKYFGATFFPSNDVGRQNTAFFGRGTAEETLPLAVGRLIGTILAFSSVIMLLLVVYAGYLWLTAGGGEEQVTKAKTILRNAVIGLIISLSAFVITSFVVNEFTQRLVDPNNPQPSGSGGGQFTFE